MKLKEAVEHFGSKTKLAEALQINKSAVTNWGESIPPGRQFEIEVKTGGILKADRNPETETTAA